MNDRETIRLFCCFIDNHQAGKERIISGGVTLNVSGITTDIHIFAIFR
jgi:hypothetical protein